MDDNGNVTKAKHYCADCAKEWALPATNIQTTGTCDICQREGQLLYQAFTRGWHYDRDLVQQVPEEPVPAEPEPEPEPENDGDDTSGADSGSDDTPPDSGSGDGGGFEGGGGDFGGGGATGDF